MEVLAVAPWVRTWLYPLAWWSLLILLAGVERIALGRSRLLDRPRSFAAMALVSIPWWLLYEALNLRLRDWAYDGLPAELWLRWAGYALSFATVLPAVLGIAELLQPAAERLAELRPRPGLASPKALQAFELAGAGWLALTLLWPRLFFPLAWGFVPLLLEPRLLRDEPERSWLGALSRGRAGPAAALLVSGSVCGLLWELLNYWAGARWVYTLPWPRAPKLFEMPLLGYLGFPPFALGCGSFWAYWETRWRRAGWGERAALCACLAALSAAVLAAVDRTTVRSLLTGSG